MSLISKKYLTEYEQYYIMKIISDNEFAKIRRRVITVVSTKIKKDSQIITTGIGLKMKKATIATLVALTATISMGQIAFAQGESITNLNDFKENVKVHMVNRDNSFSINYTGNTTEFLANVNETIKQAYSSDDYLKWSWTNISPKVTGVSGNITVTFTVSYISTKEQEDFITQKSREIVSQIITADMTQSQKVKSIYDYVTNNVKYDFSLQKKSAYNALTEGTSTCLGYAQLMDKMLEEAGIQTFITTGNITSGFHAWNLALIDGNWFHFDATNGSISDSVKYNYFGKSDTDMAGKNYTWDRTVFPSATQTYAETVVSVVSVVPVVDYKTPLFIKNLSTATIAVKSAETYKTQTYLDRAVKAVGLLTDSQEKSVLNARIDIVRQIMQDIIELKNLTTATSAVTSAESYKTETYLNRAVTAVGLLPDSSSKAELNIRINILKEAMEQKKIDTATVAVVKAEKYKTSTYTKLAEAYVLLLKDGSSKTSLSDRINTLKQPGIAPVTQTPITPSSTPMVIPVVPVTPIVSPVNPIKLIQDTTLKIIDAEKNKTDYFIDRAQTEINKLADSAEKTELQKRINNIIEANYQKLVNYATTQVANAERYKKSIYVTNAEKYVSQLRDGEYKTSLIQRISIVKTAIGMN